MKKSLACLLVLTITTAACNINADLPTPIQTATPTLPVPSEVPATWTPIPSETPPPTLTWTPTPTETNTPIPVVESLNAVVTADKLSCRYGPGAEYLYFDGLRKDWKLKLVGRTDGNNWVLVQGKNQCWVNAKFIEIQGDKQTLKVMYPAGYKLPTSPYYPAPTGITASRSNTSVTVHWDEIALRAGDEEDDSMFKYIIEVWRCESKQIIFDPLASNYPEVTFIDEPGCDIPSHGRIFFQEKHGFAGPSEIPIPPQP